MGRLGVIMRGNHARPGSARPIHSVPWAFGYSSVSHVNFDLWMSWKDTWNTAQSVLREFRVKTRKFEGLLRARPSSEVRHPAVPPLATIPADWSDETK